MSDVNASVMAVDRALDLLAKYGMELSDLHARGRFEIQSIGQLAASKKYENQVRMEELQAESLKFNEWEEDWQNLDQNQNQEWNQYQNQNTLLQVLWQKQERYELLMERTVYGCEEKAENWDNLYRYCQDLIDDGKKIMGEYILALNRIMIKEGNLSSYVRNGEPSYYVVIVEKDKYPQTAEHIVTAIKKGMPEFVTLGREDAAERRKESLKGMKTRPEYDRDEWPMACFREGGAGADIWYIAREDNRGSGSAIGQQMRGIPDGSVVRLRVI